MKSIFTFCILIFCTAAYTQNIFTETTSNAGIANTGFNYGVAVGDYDNDGLEDLYFSRSNDESNVLYKNMGGGVFEDRTTEAGLMVNNTTIASSFADIDNDGDLDLFVGNRNEADVLYLNNGDGTFTDISASAGIQDISETRSANWADVNGDGYLDLYCANLNAANALLINNGDNTFTDQTVQSGVTDNQTNMASIFFDYDKDGDQDLYVTHDANQPYLLFQNNGAGIFTEVGAQAGVNYAGQGMGVDVGDINQDGWMDIYITNLSYNTLFLNNGDGAFDDISFDAGVTDPGMGWGTTFIDCDNNGLLDIYMVNDSYFSPLPNILYRNNGDNTFTIIADEEPVSNMYGSYGTATFDYNLDGKMDLVVANSGMDGNQLFQNSEAESGNYVQFQLEGTMSNRMAIGARLEATIDGKLYVDEVTAGSGYASQNTTMVHFGIAASTDIQEVKVYWPSGQVETFANLQANQRYQIVEGESIVVSTSSVAADEEISLGVFPNPSNGPLHIYWDSTVSGNGLVRVLNNTGQSIFEQRVAVETDFNTISVTLTKSLPKGLYFVQVQVNGQMYTTKWIKQ